VNYITVGAAALSSKRTAFFFPRVFVLTSIHYHYYSYCQAQDPAGARVVEKGDTAHRARQSVATGTSPLPSHIAAFQREGEHPLMSLMSLMSAFFFFFFFDRFRRSRRSPISWPSRRANTHPCGRLAKPRTHIHLWGWQLSR
jgi:hypothetical protein